MVQMANSNYDDNDTAILILGGSGFLGLQTAQTLFYFYDVNSSYKESIAPIFYPEYNWTRLNFLESNLFEKNLLNIISRFDIKYVINFGAISSPMQTKESPIESYQVNVQSNKIITKICNEKKIFPIFISSDHVFNGLEGPYAEESLTNPLVNSIYGKQKAEAERIYQNEENYAILRLSTTLGINHHFQKKNFYGKILSALKNGKEINSASNKLRTPTHYFNIPFMINKIIEKHSQGLISNGIFHIPGEFISEYHLAIKIAESHDLDTSLIRETIIDQDNDSYPLKLGLKSEKTLKILQGRYLSLSEGLKLLYDDFTQDFD